MKSHSSSILPSCRITDQRTPRGVTYQVRRIGIMQLARTRPVTPSGALGFVRVRVSEAFLDVQELVDPDECERPADLGVCGR
jgi:hypothetical protein